MPITIVGERGARVGSEFIYCGPISECRDCRLKNVCFALDEGKRYRVTKVREVRHDCEVHDGGARVVEVEPLAIPMAVGTVYAIGGSTMTVSPREPCPNIACEHFRLCFPVGVREGDRLRVVSVSREFPCPRGGRYAAIQAVKSD